MVTYFRCWDGVKCYPKRAAMTTLTLTKPTRQHLRETDMARREGSKLGSSASGTLTPDNLDR